MPRPGCDCRSCRDAREKGYSRLGPSLYVHDEKILFDTPEDVAVELNNAGIGDVRHIFYTHWHPDHLLGMRVIEQICTKWSDELAWKIVPKCRISVRAPGVVMDEIMQRYGVFFDFWKKMGIAETEVMGGDGTTLGRLKIDGLVTKSVHRTTTHSTVYLISEGGKKLVYAPCDIWPFPHDERLNGCDMMILQIGWWGETMAARAAKGPHYEISLAQIFEILDRYRPKSVVLTHIGDELDATLEELLDMEKKHSKYNLKIACDGMEISL
ncbi:MAG: MBL fold metallo-hydrolase [Candidatus Dadabacteria bacterium]|nr:MBL fold metallo-hydrolase [Candidatus Dadabacteria bacterium]